MTAQIPYWMKRFLRQDMLEEKQELETPVRLLDTKARSFIRWLCKQHSVTSDGVMGQACSLLERYLARKMKLYSLLPRQPLITYKGVFRGTSIFRNMPAFCRNSNQWIQIKKDMAMRVPLLASVCIALTTKMISTEHQLHAKAIRKVLARMKIDLTLAQVNAAEMDVLSSLDFHIPLFTNVEKALMMAVDVGMTGVLLETVGLVMEVTEHYRYDIQEVIISVAISMSENKNIRRRDIANVRHVHLVAGSVAATDRFFLFSGRDPVPRLAFLTQCSRVYVMCICDVIYKCLVTECRTYNDRFSRKRKHE